MAYQTFPLKYNFRVDVEKTPEFFNRTVQFESGKKQKQRTAVNKLITWKINCAGNADEADTLEDFHDAMGGSYSPFYFYDEKGNQKLVRFTDDKLPMKYKREFSTNLMGGKVVGFSCDITLELVI